MKTRLILIGGFLGAGKTTLLWDVAQRLARRGQRVGLITNDQAPELVDTVFLSRGETKVAEVSGSCFCCNFPGLLKAMSDVQTEAKADVLIAEPVGSCTDLSATIVQPLKDQLQSELAVSPLSVLVDPIRLADILKGGNAGLHPSAAYIFRKQMEEADILLIGKSDLISEPEIEALRSDAARVYPLAKIFSLSVVNGEGIDAWLDLVLASEDSGTHLAQVDYDIYAEGEAVLGWLNATYHLQSSQTHWSSFVERFLKALSNRFDALGASVGHVKIIVEAAGGFVVANLTGTVETLTIRGADFAAHEARMTLNARVEMSPETLESIVQEELALCLGETVSSSQVALRCLSPGRPQPSYRFEHVVTLSQSK